YKAQSLLDSKKEIINYKPQEVIEGKEDTPSPTKEWNIEKPQAQAVEEISKSDPIISEKVEKPITEESKVVEEPIEQQNPEIEQTTSITNETAQVENSLPNAEVRPTTLESEQQGKDESVQPTVNSGEVKGDASVGKKNFEMTREEYTSVLKRMYELLSNAKIMRSRFKNVEEARDNNWDEESIDKWIEYGNIDKNGFGLTYDSMVLNEISQGNVPSEEAFKDNPKLIEKTKLTIENGSFEERIKQGKITKENTIKIIKNAGLTVPKSIRNLPETPQPKSKGDVEVGEISPKNSDVTKDYSLKQVAKNLVSSKNTDESLSKLTTQIKIDLYKEIKKQKQSDKMSKEWSDILEEETNHPSAQFLLNSIYYSFDKKGQEKLDSEGVNEGVKPNNEGVKSDLELAKEARIEARKKLDESGLGISYDSKQRAELHYNYHKALVTEAKEYIKLGVKTLNDFAKKLGEKVSVSVKLAWDEANGDIKPILNADELNYDFDNFNDEVEEKDDKKEAFERKEGEKSLFKRVYEGETDDVLKNIVETHGLNYKIENQIEVQKLAKEFVKKAGINKALEALKNNLIKGAEKAFVYAEVLDVLTNTSETASLDELLKIQEDYSSITDDAMVAFDEEARSAGRFISALYKIYQTSKIKYNLTKQINDYKANNNGEISEEVLTKFKEADKKIQELEIKIKEILEKQKKEEGDDAIESINESIEREKTKKIKQITNTDKAKLIANNIRKAKIHKPSMFASATPASIVWDGAVETVAKSIELGVSITDAIRNGVDFIKNSDWFKSLNKQDKSNALNEFQSNIINISGQQLVVVSDDGKIKVPEQLIRDLVESGINDIDILSKEVLNILKESYPDYDITIREVRDAITKYGKTVNPSKDHISIEIAKLKRTRKLISALEDVISGKRPKKSGFLRAKPTQTKRELRSKVNYLLKEFPINEADLEKAWKTALEKYKTRLENQIEDIEKQRSERKKTVTKKENLKLDEDAIELKRKRDELKERLNEMVGKPEVSYEKKIENTIKALEKSIESIKNQITDKNIEYKEKPTQITNNEIERLRKIKESNLKELNKLREEAGIVEKRRLKQAKTRLENQIKLYQKKLKDKDFSKRKLKPLESDGELKNLNKEKVHWQEVFEKERYKLELENKTRKEKFKDIIIGLLNIPRILTAGAEWSMMLIQGGIQTASLATRNPKALARTFAKAIIATGSQRKMNEYTEILKSHEKYPLMKQTKLALTESDYKMELREEEHIGNNLVYGLWNLIGDGIEYGSIKVFGIKNVGSIGSTLVSIIKKDIKSNKIPISERWKNMNPLLAFERGNTIYMNELRRLRFEDGVKMLQMEGKNEIDHIEDYKKLSSAVNTMTGRANLGRLEQVNDIISVIFFSFKNTVSVFNQLNPYFYASLHSPNDPITKASTAQKLIVRDMLNFVTITTSMMFLLQAAAGSDEDDEPLIQIDTDPRSSDFMQMKLKGKEKYIRFDPWHGMRPQVVFFAKFISGLQKNKEGKIKRIGKGFKADTQWDNFMRTYIENKLSPSASIVYKYMDSEIKTIKGEEIRVRFNEPISESFDENFYPMYINALIEIEKEDPSLIIRFLSVSSMFGVNTGVYGDINKKDK
ncbi:MAG: coiled-coil domain-containing protein, partial [Coriobacteriia bacterium]